MEVNGECKIQNSEYLYSTLYTIHSIQEINKKYIYSISKQQKNPSRGEVFLKAVYENYLTAALNSEPALKVTTFIAGILIF